MTDEREVAERASWFAQTMRDGSHPHIGEQPAALIEELETVFVAGAWVASVILAAAIIDAHLRQMEGAGQHTPAGVVWREAGLDEDFHWLRQHRNRLLHFGEEPYLTPDMFWFQKDDLEADARRAVVLAAQALSRGL